MSAKVAIGPEISNHSALTAQVEILLETLKSEADHYNPEEVAKAKAFYQGVFTKEGLSSDKINLWAHAEIAKFFKVRMEFQAAALVDKLLDKLTDLLEEDIKSKSEGTSDAGTQHIQG